MRLDQNRAIDSFFNEGSTTASSHVNSTRSDVFYVDAFDCKRQYHHTACQMFDYHIFFATVLLLSFPDCLVT